MVPEATETVLGNLSATKGKAKNVTKVKDLIGGSSEAQEILAKYKNIIRILPKEFDLKKIKKLSYAIISKLSKPHAVFEE